MILRYNVEYTEVQCQGYPVVKVVPLTDSRQPKNVAPWLSVRDENAQPHQTLIAKMWIYASISSIINPSLQQRWLMPASPASPEWAAMAWSFVDFKYGVSSIFDSSTNILAPIQSCSFCSSLSAHTLHWHWSQGVSFWYHSWALEQSRRSAMTWPPVLLEAPGQQGWATVSTGIVLTLFQNELCMYASGAPRMSQNWCSCEISWGCSLHF